MSTEVLHTRETAEGVGGGGSVQPALLGQIFQIPLERPTSASLDCEGRWCRAIWPGGCAGWMDVFLILSSLAVLCNMVKHCISTCVTPPSSLLWARSAAINLKKYCKAVKTIRLSSVFMSLTNAQKGRINNVPARIKWLYNAPCILAKNDLFNRNRKAWNLLLLMLYWTIWLNVILFYFSKDYILINDTRWFAFTPHRPSHLHWVHLL